MTGISKQRRAARKRVTEYLNATETLKVRALGLSVTRGDPLSLGGRSDRFYIIPDEVLLAWWRLGFRDRDAIRTRLNGVLGYARAEDACKVLDDASQREAVRRNWRLEMDAAGITLKQHGGANG